jgi:alkyl hydroperoxide reductase subunit AhpC
MEQIVDLQNDPDFRALGVSILSIAFDSQEEQAAGMIAYHITDVPMLEDRDHSVSRNYGVLEWAVGTGEPGHTFILVDAQGNVSWIQDYGAPENRGVMYVPVEELTFEIERHLNK